VRAAPDHVDVLIVGAGLSGVAAACHLQQRLPHKSYAILEARGAIGGTWDLFRYPGVRSDSDMFTLGYSFRPWRGAQQLADGPSILAYVRETAREHGVERHVRYGHRVLRASWSTENARWTVEAEHAGETVRLTCSFLFGCTGYYRYDRGHQPAFAGLERYGGRLVHPQHWPDDLDHTGKRVVVVGSGATAVTLVPAMAERAAHVTMLQRSPTYVVALPGEDPLAARALRVLPARVAHPLLRWKNVLLTLLSFQLSRRRPALARRLFLEWATARLPAGYDVATHFTPAYDPWDQRLCVVPDGDLFEAIGAGRASVVTDEVDTFTERGIRVRSGAELEADVVVVATGLELLPLGGLELTVDGDPVDLPATVAYKGTMLSGVPNLALALGYTNASWTLKCELICRYVCRLLAHMDAHGFASATPTLPAGDLATRPFLDLASGYVQRAIARFPRQGTARPWRAYQNYVLDLALMRFGPVDDDLTLRRATCAPPPRSPLPALAGTSSSGRRT
jgi:monooxygenase